MGTGVGGGGGEMDIGKGVKTPVFACINPQS